MTPLYPQEYLSAACEVELTRHGDSFRGVGYTRSELEAATMYMVMLEVIREKNEPLTLLDLGCGLAHMLDHMRRNAIYDNVRYTGLDISRRYLDAARSRHPQTEFILMDVLKSDENLPTYDYVVLNGLFNYRGEIGVDQMLAYWRELIAVAYRHCRRAIAFNVMSKIVDWERDDLFHLPFEMMSSFISVHLSRHFVIRHDYGTYEYTTYVYRSPC